MKPLAVKLLRRDFDGTGHCSEASRYFGQVVILGIALF